MRRRVVCDASCLVAVLLDSGSGGRWATEALADADLAAPHLVTFEVANVMRRHERAGLVSADQAAQAHGDLLELAVEHWPYELVAWRAWELRSNLSSYDASCVALAEMLDAPLVTLDRALGRAPGLRCDVLSPDDAPADPAPG